MIGKNNLLLIPLLALNLSCAQGSFDSTPLDHIPPVLGNPEFQKLEEGVLVSCPIEGDCSAVKNAYFSFGDYIDNLSETFNANREGSSISCLIPYLERNGNYYCRATVDNGRQKIESSTITLVFNNKKPIEPASDTIVFIPDKYFKECILTSYDRNSDGEISKEEAKAVSSIVCYSDQVADLTGIEQFPHLKELTVVACRDGEVSEGEVSSADLSGNPELEILTISHHRLSSVDLSCCPYLKDVNLYDNSISAIDLTKLSLLQSLVLDMNKLTSVDVTNCPILDLLTVGNNYLLSIDISKNTQLSCFACNDNSIRKIDVSNNPYLRYLTLSANKLTELSIDGHKCLESIAIGQNDIHHLSLKNIPKLHTLTIGFDYSLSFEYEGLGNLSYLSLICCDLKSFDFSTFPKLERLECFGNLFSTIDLRNNKLINSLICSPMTDNNVNTLKTLYLPSGAVIEGVTQNRSSDFVPEETQIIFAE